MTSNSQSAKPEAGAPLPKRKLRAAPASKNKKAEMAIVYDFDGALAPGNMQEHQFLPEIGIKPKAFWKEVNKINKRMAYWSICISCCAKPLPRMFEFTGKTF